MVAAWQSEVLSSFGTHPLNFGFYVSVFQPECDIFATIARGRLGYVAVVLYGHFLPEIRLDPAQAGFFV